MAKVLLVDDDNELLALLREHLETEGYLVDVAGTGMDAKTFLSISEYDLCILDYNLPDMFGPEICRYYKSRGGLMPVLFLTGRNDLVDKVEGFQSGADDYLCKPFHIKELLLRAKVLLRRSTGATQGLIQAGPIVLDLDKNCFYLNGAEIRLAPVEHRLLEYLVLHPNRSHSSESLVHHVWGACEEPDPQTVKQAVKRLRQKIDPQGMIIKNERGFGYRVDTNV